MNKNSPGWTSVLQQVIGPAKLRQDE